MCFGGFNLDLQTIVICDYTKALTEYEIQSKVSTDFKQFRVILWKDSTSWGEYFLTYNLT